MEKLSSCKKLSRDEKNDKDNQVNQSIFRKLGLGWLYRKLIAFRSNTTLTTILLITISIQLAQASSQNSIDLTSESKKLLNESIGSGKFVVSPSNHRMEYQDNSSLDNKSKLVKGNYKARSSRQYDSLSQLATAGTGNFASISGDGAAYVGQVPISGGQNYVNQGIPSAYVGHGSDSGSVYHDSFGRAYGPYPMQHPSPGAFMAQAHQTGPLSSLFNGGGLLANSMAPLMSKGFDLSEVVCTAIAVAIGAVIVGAPFILIYLFVVNQVNGSGTGMNPSGGPISLTGPPSSTNVSGRKKRQTSIHEALFKQLSPLVEGEKVAQTFKMLMDSIAKYQI